MWAGQLKKLVLVLNVPFYGLCGKTVYVCELNCGERFKDVEC